MNEVLTGVFSGVLCALISGSFGYAYSKRFDFWFLVVGALFGLFAVQLGATFFGWQEWLYMIGALMLFEYGGKVVWRKIGVNVKVDRERVLVNAFNFGTVVYIELFLEVLFLWFLPFALNRSRFMFWELEYETWVFRWFATDIPQIVRDAFVLFIVFGFPLMAVFSYHALASLAELIKHERRRRLGTRIS